MWQVTPVALTSEMGLFSRRAIRSFKPFLTVYALHLCLTWEDAEVADLSRQEWRQSLTQCVHLDAGIFLNGMRYINPRFTYLLTYKVRVKFKLTIYT